MSRYFSQHRSFVALTTVASIVTAIVALEAWTIAAQQGGHDGRLSHFLRFSAPAGTRPAATNAIVDGVSATVLPNGRLVTPAGVEVNVQAPKPFGMALSPDGTTIATLNSGAGPFSLTLITQLRTGAPVVRRIDVNATFMGVVFSPDGKRVYLSGGDDDVDAMTLTCCQQMLANIC